MSRTVLLVDDDPRILETLAKGIRAIGVDVRPAPDAETALGELAASGAQVVLTDVEMPGMSGLDLLRVVGERAPEVDVILMTGLDDLRTIADAMRDGAVDFLVKPIELHYLHSVLERVFEDRAARASARAADGGGPEARAGGWQLVGRHPRMVEVFKTVGRVTATRAPVLIRGESGSGKELIARAIHESSRRAGEPFVAVNCTALASTLLESELFGHVKGAFTGAVSDRRGRFAAAGRGTVFLDEIGDTALDFQAKLLRVLQEREYFPVGADRPAPVEARILAATHRPLERLVAEGDFREDLYYRLRVVEISVPPLRERMSDLAELAEVIIARALEATGQTPKRLTSAAMRALHRHDWPGNVRELENCLTRAVVMADGWAIRPEHLLIGGASAVGLDDLAPLDVVIQRHATRVLAACGGNKTRSAEVLGVSRPRLDRILRKAAETAPAAPHRNVADRRIETSRDRTPADALPKA